MRGQPAARLAQALDALLDAEHVPTTNPERDWGLIAALPEVGQLFSLLPEVLVWSGTPYASDLQEVTNVIIARVVEVAEYRGFIEAKPQLCVRWQTARGGDHWVKAEHVQLLTAPGAHLLNVRPLPAFGKTEASCSCGQWRMAEAQLDARAEHYGHLTETLWLRHKTRWPQPEKPA